MAMTRYFEPYLDVARRHGTGFVLEANTWRANPSWGAQLGYSLDELAEANRRCIASASWSRRWPCSSDTRRACARACSARSC